MYSASHDIGLSLPFLQNVLSRLQKSCEMAKAYFCPFMNMVTDNFYAHIIFTTFKFRKEVFNWIAAHKSHFR